MIAYTLYKTNGDVAYIAEIGCDGETPDSTQKRLALRCAFANKGSLVDVDLSGACLSGQSFLNVDLTGANLSGADLKGSMMSAVNFRGANLTGADFTCALIDRTKISWAELSKIKLPDGIEVPTITNIHQRIYDAAKAEGALDMEVVHACETTHCRAGWTIHLAGEAGYALQKAMGWSVAATLIYKKSDPDRDFALDFITTNDKALADMKRQAELEAKGVTQ